MLTQSLAIVLLAVSSQFWLLVTASILLGLGTAMVYPNFMTVWLRIRTLHNGRIIKHLSLLEDSGYVIGALLAGYCRPAGCNCLVDHCFHYCYRRY